MASVGADRVGHRFRDVVEQRRGPGDEVSRRGVDRRDGVLVHVAGVKATLFDPDPRQKLGEDLLERVPFVRALYSGVKSFSETVFSKSGSSFKKVLLVEYPRVGLWSMGFQTTDHLDEISERLGEPQVCVFIPTTPNPTSGFIFFVPRSKCIELDMSVDSAMKMIVTLGVVGPGSHSATGTHPAAAAHPAVTLTLPGPRD